MTILDTALQQLIDGTAREVQLDYDDCDVRDEMERTSHRLGMVPFYREAHGRSPRSLGGALLDHLREHYPQVELVPQTSDHARDNPGLLIFRLKEIRSARG